MEKIPVVDQEQGKTKGWLTVVWLMKNESAESVEKEWLILMLTAKEMGLSPVEVRAFLKKQAPQ